MSVETRHANGLMQGLSFFSMMDAAERESLLQHATLRNFSKRVSLFHQGDRADRFFIIVSGWVKLYSVTEEGREIVIGMLSADDIIGDAAAFEDTLYPFSAMAAEDVQMIEIPSAVIRERARVNPDMASQIMTIMTHKIHNLLVTNGLLTVMDTQQRLSCLLLRLSSWMIGEGGTFSLPYDKSIVAAQLGMEPATLSRILVKLHDKGVTSKGPEISIRNFAALSASCCSHCPLPEGQCAGRRSASDKRQEIKNERAA